MSFVTVLICAASLTLQQCNAQTARAVIRFRSDVLICGYGATAAGAGATAPDQAEYVRVRCEAGR